MLNVIGFIKKRWFLLLFIFVITIGLFKGITWHDLAASINKSSFDLYDENPYNYLPVSFPKVDLSSIPNIHDYDEDGIENALDMVHGARIFIESNPVYESGYYDGGYPPLGTGVCTDVIAFAFLSAGYNLRDMVHQDIMENRSSYPDVVTVDKNIDYRRVKNLQVFFDRYAQNLTTEVKVPEEWQAGDILIFPHHIGILSDKKNIEGYPYIIHHGGQENLEEDVLLNSTILRHYRFGK